MRLGSLKLYWLLDLESHPVASSRFRNKFNVLLAALLQTMMIFCFMDQSDFHSMCINMLQLSNLICSVHIQKKKNHSRCVVTSLTKSKIPSKFCHCNFRFSIIHINLFHFFLLSDTVWTFIISYKSNKVTYGITQLLSSHEIGSGFGVSGLNLLNCKMLSSWVYHIKDLSLLWPPWLGFLWSPWDANHCTVKQRGPFWPQTGWGPQYFQT